MPDYKMTEAAAERTAKALAEARNGGRWEEHYTASHKKLWIMRVREAEKMAA